jgi:hypothetical protein
MLEDMRHVEARCPRNIESGSLGDMKVEKGAMHLS